MWVTKISLGVMLDNIRLLEQRVLEAKKNLSEAREKLQVLQEGCMHEDVRVRLSELPFLHKHVHCLDCDLTSFYFKDTEGYADPAQHMRGWHE